MPVLVVLHLVGSEWLTMCEYIKTRLNQIDMEFDLTYSSGQQHFDAALDKLTMWRRSIPLYREMVSETLQHIFKFGCPKLKRTQHQSWESSTPSCPRCAPNKASLQSWDMKAYEEEYRLVLARLEEYQSRIDRLTSVATAVMAVQDTRRAITDARNIGFLTWLATFFLPFGVFSGIFSMQKLEDISLGTIRVYFAVTLPVAFVTLVTAWIVRTSRASKRRI